LQVASLGVSIIGFYEIATLPGGARNDRKYPPSPQPSPSEGRGSKKGNIYPSTYINPKKRSFYRVVDKK